MARLPAGTQRARGGFQDCPSDGSIRADSCWFGLVWPALPSGAVWPGVPGSLGEGLVGTSGVSRARGWGVFRSLAGNRALAQVVGGYGLFTLTQYSVWVAMLVYAYRHGGAAVAGLVAVAQLMPAAVLAPVATALADRRSPVFLLAGGYLVQAAGMAATAVAVVAGVPLAAYAAAVVASAAVATTR